MRLRTSEQQLEARSERRRPTPISGITVVQYTGGRCKEETRSRATCGSSHLRAKARVPPDRGGRLPTHPRSDDRVASPDESQPRCRTPGKWLSVAPQRSQRGRGRVPCHVIQGRDPGRPRLASSSNRYPDGWVATWRAGCRHVPLMSLYAPASTKSGCNPALMYADRLGPRETLGGRRMIASAIYPGVRAVALRDRGF
jgi:hypothetical protein